MRPILIFISAAIVNNFVLTYFLGICPFIGMSRRVETAISMGLATTFVMAITAPVAWLINRYILVGLNLPFLQFVSFIIAIASTVQFVEMYVRKTSPTLYRSLGIFLPLITTNCAVLGLALFEVLRGYSLIESIFFGFGAGLGFTLAMALMSSIREELRFSDVPKPLKGAAITLIASGLLAMAFMGFAGMLSV